MSHSVTIEPPEKLERLSVNCPVCDCNESSLVMPIQDHSSGVFFSMHECRHCHVFFLKDPPTPQALHFFYDNWFGATMRVPGNPLYAAMRQIAYGRDLSPLTARLPVGARILDYGTGDGSVAEALLERGYQVEAVDMFPAERWKRSNIPYRQVSLHGSDLSAHDLSVHGQTPEGMIIRHVLEHVFAPSKVLDAAWERGVKYIVIVVPNRKSYGARLLKSAWSYWDPPRHLTSFHQEALDVLADRAGYRVAFAKTYGIDELFTTLYRVLLLSMLKEKRPVPSWVGELIGPRSALAAISSALSFMSNTVCYSLLERCD